MSKIPKKQKKQRAKLENEIIKLKIDAVKNYTNGGASRYRNDMKGFNVTVNTPDEDIGENLDTLVARSLDLFMNSPLATGAIKTIRTNVIGSGLKLNAAIDFEYLKLTSDQANEWEKDIEREWRLWSESPNCDATRRMNFGQIQQLATVSSLISGDCFVTLPRKKRAGTPYQTTVQLIDGSRVRNPDVGIEGGRVFNGIEIDAHGEALAAYIHHGYESQYMDTGYTRVPFYGEKSGRPLILQIMQDWERIGQRRGVPLLAPVIIVLKQLNRYTDAELAASLVASMFTAFLTTESPQTDLMGLSTITEEERVSNPEMSIELQRGGIVALQPGQDLKTAEPTRDTGAFDTFVTSLTRQIGAALEIPQELLVKHFTSSYSASRAALLEFWKMAHMRRAVLSATLCQPIYEEWLSEAVALGRVKAPGFFDDPSIRAAWCGAEWYGPKQGHLNPLQEAKAIEVLIDNDLTTREKAASEVSGQAWEDIAPVRVREEKYRRDNGLGEQLKPQGVLDELVTD